MNACVPGRWRMGPDEYRICVVSGSDARRGPLYVDAYVYMWGGRNVARFSASTVGCPSVPLEPKREAELRRQVRREARAWIKQASA